jgi:two-component sensor histidine kinase
MRDISERKNREEQIKSLLREVNHRSKNLLTVVQAIARRTAASAPADFAEKFSGRLRALAANQDLLVSSEWRGVDIHTMIGAQLAHFPDMMESRISIDGPSLTLQPAAAQAIGMAIHELATNAIKYGALSNDIGTVTISWRVDGDMLVLNWAEHGGPECSPPPQRGFGSTVVEQMAARSVGGTVAFEFAGTGVKWTMSCPLDKAIEPPDRRHDFLA